MIPAKKVVKLLQQARRMSCKTPSKDYGAEFRFTPGEVSGLAAIAGLNSIEAKTLQHAMIG